MKYSEGIGLNADPAHLADQSLKTQSWFLEGLDPRIQLIEDLTR